MDFTGVVLFTVSSKGSMVDLRLAFLASQGKQNLALYFFDKESSAADQAIADSSVRARVEKKRPKYPIQKIGERADSPNQQTRTEAFDKLATVKGEKAVIKISKSGKGSFDVRIEKIKSKMTALSVPFSGDPDTFAEQTFHGQLSLIASSKDPDADIPGLINIIVP